MIFSNDNNISRKKSIHKRATVMLETRRYRSFLTGAEMTVSD
jgi:hypothetical protein